MTILLVEQNMKLAEAVADELHVMVKGRMVYAATPERFRAEEAGNSQPLSDGLTWGRVGSLHLSSFATALRPR